MNEDLNPESDNLSSEEKEFEQVLRPKLFSDFKGQEKIVDNLEVSGETSGCIFFCIFI